MVTIIFDMRDNVIYDECRDVTPAAIVNRGDPIVRQDVLGFYHNSTLQEDEEVAVIYRCRQVRAQKKTGTGFNFVSGDKVYFIVADNKVSPTPSGVAGQDYYFCGWAKDNAGVGDETVLINFDGTRYAEAV